MDEKYKVLVAHPAQQHSFRTAAALKNTDFLYKYITTVYDKEGSITRMSKFLLKGDNFKRAQTRKSIDLEDSEVVQVYESLGLLLLLLQRIDKKKKIYGFIEKITINLFNKKVAKYAIKHNVDAVIMFDTLSYNAFEILEKKAPQIKRILDMSAPSIEYMDDIFKKDIKLNPKYSKELIEEMETSRYKSKIERGKREFKAAQYYLVASNFTKKSLEYHNIDENNIFTCRYGIDTSLFKNEQINKDNKDKLKCIFIGNITRKKGVHYLFDAIENLDSNNYHFVFLGNYDENSQYYNDYKEKCDFVGHVTKDKVIEYCQNADVIIFPSLADGFGLSVIEALACGTAAICSKNAGVSDLIINKYNGFTVPASNSLEIYEKLKWCEENRLELEEMKKNAVDTATKSTWNQYDFSIMKSVDLIMKNCKEDKK